MCPLLPFPLLYAVLPSVMLQLLYWSETDRSLVNFMLPLPGSQKCYVHRRIGFQSCQFYTSHSFSGPYMIRMKLSRLGSVSLGILWSHRGILERRGRANAGYLQFLAKLKLFPFSSLTASQFVKEKLHINLSK